MAVVSDSTPSDDQRRGQFEQALDLLQVARRRGAVERAMVERQVQIHRLALHDLSVEAHQPGKDAANAEDGHLRRIDDGGEEVDAELAEGGDGEGAALQVVETELISTSAR